MIPFGVDGLETTEVIPHTIVAPMDGLVAAVHYRVNDLVEEGVDLRDLEF